MDPEVVARPVPAASRAAAKSLSVTVGLSVSVDTRPRLAGGQVAPARVPPMPTLAGRPGAHCDAARPRAEPLLLLRHAESEWNALGLWQGQADPSLSTRGRAQALRAAAALSEQGAAFDQVVSSDLRRAAETADLLRRALGVPGGVKLDVGLREFDVGRWSGLTRVEIEARWPGQLEAVASGAVPGPPGGETNLAFRERAVLAVQTLAASEGRLLVVAHGGVIRAIAAAAAVELGRIGYCSGIWVAAAAYGLSAIQEIELLLPEFGPASQAV